MKPLSPVPLQQDAEHWASMTMGHGAAHSSQPRVRSPALPREPRWPKTTASRERGEAKTKLDTGHRIALPCSPRSTRCSCFTARVGNRCQEITPKTRSGKRAEAGERRWLSAGCPLLAAHSPSRGASPNLGTPRPWAWPRCSGFGAPSLLLLGPPQSPKSHRSPPHHAALGRFRNPARPSSARTPAWGALGVAFAKAVQPFRKKKVLNTHKLLTFSFCSLL